MSGGHFDYKQYAITEIAEEIRRTIKRSGKPIPLRHIHFNNELGGSTMGAFYEEFSNEVMAEFKNAIEALEKAAIYAQRVDWLLSGDDSEDDFLKRLKEELTKK